MKEIVFLNGEFLPLTEAKLPVSTPGFLYGIGLFETMRSYKNRIVYFDEHLKRIENSSKLIGIEFSYTTIKLKGLIKKTIAINETADAYVRLTLYKANQGTDTLIIVKKYQPYSKQKYGQGFSVCVSEFRQNENSYLTRLKTTNYLLYKLAYRQAEDKGFDEALILNNRGYICEGSRANIFLIKDKDIFTPALECGCLDGITRKVIFGLAKKHRFRICEANFTLQDLYKADEAFLTNSLMGIMPLAAVEKRIIGTGKTGVMTKLLMEEYAALLEYGS